jgi:hypothetical protein
MTPTISLTIQEPCLEPAIDDVREASESCRRCAAPSIRGYEGCRSCDVAEALAAELNVPVREMLDIARAQWE